MDQYDRLPKEWPSWIDDILRFGPIAELEDEWRAEIGDASTSVLDKRTAILNEKKKS